MALQSTSLLYDFLISPRYRICRHLLFILLLTAVSFNSCIIAPCLADFSRFWPYVVGESLLITVSYICVAYCNIYVLIPRLLLRNHFLYYCLSMLVLALMLVSIVFSLEYIVVQQNHFGFKHSSYFYEGRITSLEVAGTAILYIICLTGSSVTVLVRHWIIAGKQITEMEQSGLQSELENLKNQISPQFLFNMLDKAGALSHESPEKASEILMKLSKLLRYQLYDSSRDKVLLSTETAFLENFLNLEKWRHPGFSFDVVQEGVVNRLVSPLLFIPFVEYFTGQIPQDEGCSFIRILFKTDNNKLIFVCTSTPVNSLARNRFDTPGLINVKRRLNLLYNDAFSLKMEANEINLQLTL